MTLIDQLFCRKTLHKQIVLISDETGYQIAIYQSTLESQFLSIMKKNTFDFKKMLMHISGVFLLYLSNTKML